MKLILLFLLLTQINIFAAERKKGMTDEEIKHCIECWNTKLCGRECHKECKCPDLRNMETWHY